MSKKIFIVLIIITIFTSFFTVVNAADKVTADDIINKGKDFLDSGDNTKTFKEDDLQVVSSNIYNVLLVGAIILSVLIGIFLGIKLVSNGSIGKAEVKEALIPYLIGNAVAFGAFGIWKLAVTVFQSMNT